MPSRKKFSRAIEKAIFEKYDHHCAICDRKINFDDGVLEHIIPLKKGGPDEPNNIQWACHRCNIIKSDKYTNEEVRELLSLSINHSNLNKYNTTDKREALKDYFEFIHSDITNMIETLPQYGYDYPHNLNKYNTIRNSHSLKLSNYENQTLLKNIEQLYRRYSIRNFYIEHYPNNAYNIINKVIEDYHSSINSKISLLKRGTTYFQIIATVHYSTGEIKEKRTDLAYDLLFKTRGRSLLREPKVAKVLPTKAVINKIGGAAIQVSPRVYEALWHQMIEASDNNSIINSLRNSVDKVIQLGFQVKSEIEKETNGLTLVTRISGFGI